MSHHLGMSQNVRPGGPQMEKSIFSIHHPTIGVLNFDPYPFSMFFFWVSLLDGTI